MRSADKTLDEIKFQPARVDSGLPAQAGWRPGLRDLAEMDTTGPAAELAYDDSGDEEGGVDDGPGSEALAARFEPLPLEWVTGEPAIETIRFELSDGLSYVGEAFEEDGPEGALKADNSLDPGDADYLDGGVDGADPEGGSAAEGDSNLVTIEPPFDQGLAEEGEPIGAAPDSPEGVDVPFVSPVGFVSEEDHAQAVGAVRMEAYAQGLSEGLEQGKSLGYQQGLAAGHSEARAELQSEVERRLTALAEAIEGVRRAVSDSERLFEPLKRLALYIGQQLVRGELTLSGEAINRLVEQCLLEFDRGSRDDLVLSLNPDDLERWRREAPSILDTVQCRPDPGLSMGSVRISAGESVVEDLIEHRLSALASRLLGDTHGRTFSRLSPLRTPLSGVEDISDVD